MPDSSKPTYIDLASRRLSPVVDRFVTTDLPLLEILDSLPKPYTPLLRALAFMHECLAGKRLAKSAIDAAQLVPMRGSDPELFIMLLAVWAELYCRINRPSDAGVLIQRARSIFADNTHPEVQAAVLLVEAQLADITGNKSHAEQLFRKAISSAPPHSPRRKHYTLELINFLALHGRLRDGQPEIKELSWQCNERFRVSNIQLAQFIDAVETGRAQQATLIMQQLETGLASFRDSKRARYSSYKQVLNLMHCHDETVPPPPDSDPSWIKVTIALLNRQPQQALEIARIDENRALSSIFGSGFESYTLIRAELAAGNWEAARRLIEMRQSRGNIHYLDNFFLAHTEHIAANNKSSASYFAEVIKALELHDSRGRLDFELRLAPRISQGQILEMTRSAEKILRMTPPSPATQQKNLPTKSTAEPRRPRIAEVSAMGNIVGKSSAIEQLREAIIKLADLNAPILITGETGTGKEMVSRALHENSNRRSFPFTAVNCGAISETLLESELFGHERGAFTGAEKANKGLFEDTGHGTILLDEIGEISPRLQTALLRVLETGEIRAVGSTKTRKIECRVLAATNADLLAMVSAGTFRRDLVYRLLRLTIHIPALHERREDILLLARHFLDEGRPIGEHATITRELTDRLLAYDWPGNVRELRNVIERMRLMHSDKLHYSIEDLDLKFQTAQVFTQRPPQTDPAPRLTANQPQQHYEPANRPHPPADPYPNNTQPNSQNQSTPAPRRITHDEEILSEGRSAVRRLETLKGLFIKHEKLTRSEVIQILNISPNTATKDLRALCEANFIERVEPSSSSRSYYFQLLK